MSESQSDDKVFVVKDWVELSRAVIWSFHNHMESSVAFVMQLSLVAACLKCMLIWLWQMFWDRRKLMKRFNKNMMTIESKPTSSAVLDLMLWQKGLHLEKWKLLSKKH